MTMMTVMLKSEQKKEGVFNSIFRRRLRILSLSRDMDISIRGRRKGREGFPGMAGILLLYRSNEVMNQMDAE